MATAATFTTILPHQRVVSPRPTGNLSLTAILDLVCLVESVRWLSNVVEAHILYVHGTGAVVGPTLVAELPIANAVARRSRTACCAQRISTITTRQQQKEDAAKAARHLNPSPSTTKEPIKGVDAKVAGGA